MLTVASPHSNRFQSGWIFIVFLSLVLGFSSPESAKAFEVNKGAIVFLIAKDQKGAEIGTGSGFIVAPEGKVITNYHVLVDAASMLAVFEDGRQAEVTGIRYIDRTRDFSILQLAGGPFSTLEIGNSKKLTEFSYTTALGYPSQSVENTPAGPRGLLVQSHGFVLGVLPQAFPDFSYIYTTTPFTPGFSGGPLLDENHKAVGVATLEGRALNLALPLHYVEPHLQSKGMKTFAQLLEEDASSKEALYFRGNFTLYGQGDPEKALSLFERALNLDPEFVPALYDMAVAYRGLGKTEAAIAQYEKALKINPRFPEALSNLGGQYFRSGQTDKAIEYFNKAVTVYPNFVQALSNLGAVLNKKERFAEALPLLKRAVHLDPEFAVSFFNLGNSYFGLKKYPEAETAFRTAIQGGVDFLSLHWKMHEIHLLQGRKDEAIRELELILELDPLHPEAGEKLKQLKSSTP